jgi:hypothetical protein
MHIRPLRGFFMFVGNSVDKFRSHETYFISWNCYLFSSFILYHVGLFNAHETFVEPTLRLTLPTNRLKRILGKEMNQHQVMSVSRPHCN